MSEQINEGPVGEYAAVSDAEGVRRALEELYVTAEEMHKSADVAKLVEALGQRDFDIALQLGRAKHAARGVALTLCAYKIVVPTQDVRAHKSEHPGGFSARSIDAGVTVPFLKSKGLSYNVETHWLSQTFSFAGPYTRDVRLKTSPKQAGPLMLEVVNLVQDSKSPLETASAAASTILYALIEERNKGRVELTKPKGLTIDRTTRLLNEHFNRGYDRNAPRLPQLAIYALYRCLADCVDRYKNLQLQPLERLKTANRKSGTVGDIDIHQGERPLEAVEIKFNIQIELSDVQEAIQKVKSASVERYLILSTVGVQRKDLEEISQLQNEFKARNGCEIIVDGVLETLRYYLRLLGSTNDFVFQYTKLLEDDPDVDYQHRIAWNELCARGG